jgi:hypothetical protein
MINNVRRKNNLKTPSRLASFIWPNSFSIILDIVGRFGVSHSRAIGLASLRRRNHGTSGWAILSVLRSVLIVGYCRVAATVILPRECGRDITVWRVYDRKNIPRLTFSDMSQ